MFVGDMWFSIFTLHIIQMKTVDQIILVTENRHHRGHMVDGLRPYVIDGYHHWRCEVDY